MRLSLPSAPDRHGRRHGSADDLSAQNAQKLDWLTLVGQVLLKLAVSEFGLRLVASRRDPWQRQRVPIDSVLQSSLGTNR